MLSIYLCHYCTFVTQETPAGIRQTRSCFEQLEQMAKHFIHLSQTCVHHMRSEGGHTHISHRNLEFGSHLKLQSFSRTHPDF